jgi:hypothetical protein
LTVPPLLESLARALAVSPAEDAAVCSQAVQRVLDGTTEGLDEAFGLKAGPGERNWRTVDVGRRRDDLIRKAAAEHFAGTTKREAAELIASELMRFRSCHDWRRSRADTVCPFQGVKAIWWQILRLVDKPLGAERSRQILGNELPAIHYPRNA